MRKDYRNLNAIFRVIIAEYVWFYDLNAYAISERLEGVRT